MIRFLLSATALTALSLSAFAADLPKRAAAPAAPAPIFSWTGVYVGGSVGYIRSRAAATDPGNGFFGATNETINSAGSGVLGGIQAGYNDQVGALVFGFEADLAAASANARAGTDVLNSRNDAHKTSALGTVRGRVGYAFDRTLVYVTGGLAYANVRNRVYNVSQPVTQNAETSGWRAGYALGGGAETAIDKNWTVKAEAFYYNVGHSQAQIVMVSGSFPFKTRNDGALARVGLNYKF